VVRFDDCEEDGSRMNICFLFFLFVSFSQKFSFLSLLVIIARFSFFSLLLTVGRVNLNFRRLAARGMVQPCTADISYLEFSILVLGPKHNRRHPLRQTQVEDFILS